MRDDGTYGYAHSFTHIQGQGVPGVPSGLVTSSPHLGAQVLAYGVGLGFLPLDARGLCNPPAPFPCWCQLHTSRSPRFPLDS